MSFKKMEIMDSEVRNMCFKTIPVYDLPEKGKDNVSFVSASLAIDESYSRSSGNSDIKRLEIYKNNY